MAAPPPALIELSEADPQFRFRLDPIFGNAVYLAGNLARDIDSEDPDSALRDFLQTHASLIGIEDAQTLRLLPPIKKDRVGTRVTYQQLHGTVPVYGGTIHLHVDKKGILKSIMNQAFPDLEGVPTDPAVTTDEAEAALRQATGSRGERHGDLKLFIYRHKGLPRLVWKVRIVDDISGAETSGESEVDARRTPDRDVDDPLPHDWIGYVDALKGEVLNFYDNVREGLGIGYYSGPGSVNSRANGSNWELKDDTRNFEIQTRLPGSGLPASFDGDNNWDRLDTIPRAQNQGAEVDAHRHAGIVADYFLTTHGVRSYDGSNSMPVQSLVHFVDPRVGFWLINKVILTDGSGMHPGYDYPSTDDWMAHELTHGYVESQVHLEPKGEEGALAEAIADTFAAFITGNWKTFEKSWLGSLWGHFGVTYRRRSLEDPTNLGTGSLFGLIGHFDSTDPVGSYLKGHMPDHYDHRYTGSQNSGGIHINSGIISHVFYLLANGGTHQHSSIAIGSIGQSPAEIMLWECVSDGLTPASDFLDLRLKMVNACGGLFPSDLYKQAQVKTAFYAAGIGPDLFIRDNLADNGNEPGSGLFLCASPDIINRQAPSSNPASDFGDLSKDDFCQNIEYGQDNYIYVRVQNRAPHHAGDATVKVYLAHATTFATPASWIEVGTGLKPGVAAGSNEIVGPIVLHGTDIPAPGHYCLIAVVNNGHDPAPNVNLIASVTDFLTYVRGSNNIAWRNVTIVDLVSDLKRSMGAWVRGLQGQLDRYDLRIDLRRFLPGTRIDVRGPADPLDGAVPRGLALVRRQGDINEYKLSRNGELKERFTEPELGNMTIGFDKVLVEAEFQLEIEYELPSQDILDAIAGNFGPGPLLFELRLEQLWNGEPVGMITQRFTPSP